MEHISLDTVKRLRTLFLLDEHVYMYIYYKQLHTHKNYYYFVLLIMIIVEGMNGIIFGRTFGRFPSSCAVTETFKPRNVCHATVGSSHFRSTHSALGDTFFVI